MVLQPKTKIVRAWEDFNRVSLKKVPDVETFSKLISLSPKLKRWYADWSFQNSAFSQMPESFRKSGITPEQWTEVANNLPLINQKRKEVSDRIQEKAEEFSRFVELQETSAKEELSLLETPLVKILKVNVTCLDFEVQMKILACPAEKREDLELLSLEKLRTKLLTDLSKGIFNDPFIHGDYKDLLA
jgi:hypothetical protein